MDQALLIAYLQDLDLPGVRFFPTIDSTNDEAWRWVDTAAPHAALVVADEQTAGRGRHDRRWITSSGSGLAFSLVLRSPPLDALHLNRLVGLAALAICKSLRSMYTIKAQIKWPNDILLNQHKAAGILVETRWMGEKLDAAVVGIGINIAPESVSPRILSPTGLNFPVTCVDDVVGHQIDRWELLHAILAMFFRLMSRLATPGFIAEWQAYLAYRDQWVELNVEPSGQPALPSHPTQVGKLVGLNANGALQLLTTSAELVTVQVGELQLRPAKPPQDMEKDLNV
jgi:BirA family biotin operon repressor/biotin-[acetyl-CoA-carboxylase] ligase